MSLGHDFQLAVNCSNAEVKWQRPNLDMRDEIFWRRRTPMVAMHEHDQGQGLFFD